MSDASRRSSADDLESEAAEIIGKLVLAFSYLEFNIGLCIRNVAAGDNVDLLNPLIDRPTFKSKLDALRELLAIKFVSNTNCVNEFRGWLS